MHAMKDRRIGQVAHRQGRKLGRAGSAAAAVLLGWGTVAAHAADPVAGKALYNTIPGSPLSCAASSCHGSDPAQGKNAIQRGANNAPVIQSAITNGVGGMDFLKNLVSTADLQNIAAYIANPAAGTPSPVIQISTATLAFGSQTVGTTSAPMVVTVGNSGSANLTISSIGLSGSNAGEFAPGGTCAAGGTVAPGSNCTVSLVFTPQGLNTRTATLAIAHNGAASPSVVTISGSGASAPAASLGLSASSVAFGDQVVGTSSAARTVTVTNSGTAAMTVNNLTVAGTNASDFQLGGSCASGSNLAPNASCTLSLTFRPGATGGRTASVAIASSATGSPHAVALNGNGVAVGAPALTLAPGSIDFGNTVLGIAGPPQSVTLTNSGGAALGITSIAVTGPGFAQNSTCGATLAPAASCTINLTFAPTVSGASSGALTVTTNAGNSPHAVPLAGAGVAQSAALATARFRPGEVEFRAQKLNTASDARSFALVNTGDQPLSITRLAVTGANASDFALTGTCPIGGVLAPKASCAIRVVFTPSKTGTRKAQITLVSNAKGRPSVELKGVGVARPGESREEARSRHDD